MRDSEIVASIVARAPQGLAEAYDRYADSLYRYCRYALTDPAQAADAVRDTFIVAAARADRLRQPERLRAWLCAIARNECQRILRGGKAATAPGLADDEEPELRALLEDAAWGLDPAEREIIELQLCQDLEPGEVAAVLGVSRGRANSRLRRAHHRLQDCVGALLVARAGQYECAVLGGMLADWDWRLTPRLRRRLHRHIGRCGTCTARRAFELRSAVLQGLPAGLWVVAAAVDSSRLSAGAPAELKASTLALAADQTPDAIAQRAAMAGRAGVFRLDGFPGRSRSAKAAPPAATESWQSSPQGRTTAGVMLAVAITAVVVAFNTNPGFFRLGTPGPARSTIAAPVHGKNGIVLPRARRPRRGPRRGPSRARPRPGPALARRPRCPRPRRPRRPPFPRLRSRPGRRRRPRRARGNLRAHRLRRRRLARWP